MRHKSVKEDSAGADLTFINLAMSFTQKEVSKTYFCLVRVTGTMHKCHEKKTQSYDGNENATKQFLSNF